MTNLKFSTKQAAVAWLINAVSTQASSRLLYQESFNQTNETLSNTTSAETIPLE